MKHIFFAQDGSIITMFSKYGLERQSVKYGNVRWKHRGLSIKVYNGSIGCQVRNCNMEVLCAKYGDVRWKDMVLSMELQDGSKEYSVWKCKVYRMKVQEGGGGYNKYGKNEGKNDKRQACMKRVG